MKKRLKLIYKSKKYIDIPVEAIDKIEFSNKWMFKKENRKTKTHTWLPIYDYVSLEFNRDKLNRETIDRIMQYKDLLLVREINEDEVVDKYIAWTGGKYQKTNPSQVNEENLFYVKIFSFRRD